MSGHATPEEVEHVTRLEQNLDPTTSRVSEFLELALLYIEPSHREEEAIRLLETALEREPKNGWIRLWLAYAYLHHLMDEVALARAAELLEPLLEDDSELAAAGRMLLAEIQEELGASDDDRIRLLEEAVERQPEWVYNRQSLAWAYGDVSRYAEAVEQIEAARENVIGIDPGWNVVARYFEELITGRAGHRALERLLEDRKRLERKLPDGGAE